MKTHERNLVRGILLDIKYELSTKDLIGIGKFIKIMCPYISIFSNELINTIANQIADYQIMAKDEESRKFMMTNFFILVNDLKTLKEGKDLNKYNELYLQFISYHKYGISKAFNMKSSKLKKNGGQ